jgi:hypothetical protein
LSSRPFYLECYPQQQFQTDGSLSVRQLVSPIEVEHAVHHLRQILHVLVDAVSSSFLLDTDGYADRRGQRNRYRRRKKRERIEEGKRRKLGRSVHNSRAQATDKQDEA